MFDLVYPSIVELQCIRKNVLEYEVGLFRFDVLRLVHNRIRDDLSHKPVTIHNKFLRVRNDAGLVENGFKLRSEKELSESSVRCSVADEAFLRVSRESNYDMGRRSTKQSLSVGCEFQEDFVESLSLGLMDSDATVKTLGSLGESEEMNTVRVFVRTDQLNRAFNGIGGTQFGIAQFVGQKLGNVFWKSMGDFELLDGA